MRRFHADIMKLSSYKGGGGGGEGEDSNATL